jgi:ADP-heptose:LPS heptosyltransferase
MSAPRFLLVSLSNVGDAIMTTAVLEALHAYAPAAVIDVVGDRRSSVIFDRCPYRGSILHKDKRQPLRGLGVLLAELRRTRYELVVDLRTDFLPLLLRARRRFCRWSGRPFGPHAVQHHLGVIRALPLPPGEFGPRVWPAAVDIARARDLLGRFHGQRLLALGPGANWAPKIWPVARFVELIELVGEQFDAVVLLGGATDRSVADALAASSPLPCMNLVGTTELMEAAAVIANARAFVGNDSGLGHLAAAMQIPTLTLFGIGDPERYHPWGPRAQWIVEPGRDLARLPATAVAAAMREMIGR